jgi:hypothetical protein
MATITSSVAEGLPSQRADNNYKVVLCIGQAKGGDKKVALQSQLLMPRTCRQLTRSHVLDGCCCFG